jgi:hypothetical protein
MPYPSTYDNIEGLDYNDCIAYSHSTTDGILGDFYVVPLGDLIRVFARYHPSDFPKLAIIKYDQTYVEKDIPGTLFNGTGMHYFDLVMGDLGETSSEGVLWQDGYYVLKVYSTESEITYSKPIKVIRTDDTCASRQDVEDLGTKIDEHSTEIQSDIDYVPSQHSGATIRM